MSHEPYSFYKILPDGRMALYVDASLMKDFAHCERYFYLKHIKNIRLKGHLAAKPFSMAIGSWWSDVMEMFYGQIRDNKPIERSHINDIALTCWHKNQLDSSASAEPAKFEKFGDIAGACLMLTEYYDSQYLNDVRTWKVISIEQGFGLKNEVLLGESSRVVVYWVGKPDLSVSESGRLVPVDHKTVTKIDGYTTSKYKPSSQMIGYVHSCEVIAKSLGIDQRVDRCVINICAREKPTDNPRNGKKRPRFIRAYPNFSREEIAEWKQNILARCERISHCLRTNEWAWAETSCHNMYMRPCDYLPLDSKTPSARDIVLLADFQEAAPWVPYKVEDDDT